MVFSKSNIAGMRKSKVAVNTLPLLNFVLFLSIVILLALYIIQINFIYGSNAMIEKYKYEMRVHREKFLELDNYSNAIFRNDLNQIKKKLNMVEGKSMDSIKIDPSEVALSK